MTQGAGHKRARDGEDDDPYLDLSTFVPFELAVLANRISQMISQIFEERFDLQVPDWRILVTLHRHGPLPPNEVAELTAMDKARVSRAQRRLSDLHLVSVLDDPEDGRRKVLSLEPRGYETCKAIIPAALKREAWLMEALSAPEEVALRELLRKLHAHTDSLPKP